MPILISSEVWPEIIGPISFIYALCVACRQAQALFFGFAQDFYIEFHADFVPALF